MAAFFGGLVDRKMRSIFFKLLGHTIRNPGSILKSAYLQRLMIIQPVNFETDGRQDMCDCCPDITVHEGKLVWSCRLEELNTTWFLIGYKNDMHATDWNAMTIFMRRRLATAISNQENGY